MTCGEMHENEKDSDMFVLRGQADTSHVVKCMTMRTQICLS